MTDLEMTDITGNGGDSPSSSGFEAPPPFLSVCDACCLEDQAVWRARCEEQEPIKKRGCYQDTGPDKGQHSPLPLPDLYLPQPERSHDHNNPISLTLIFYV